MLNSVLMKGVFMQYFSYENIIYNLERFGLFDLVLPFLLIFAIVFGVLTYTNIFGGNKGVNAIIAVVLALLAVRFPIYTDFLAVLSPKLAIGITILFALVILMGLFTPEGSIKTMGWIFVAIAVIIAFVIFVQTASFFGFPEGFYESDLVYGLITVAIIVGIVIVVIVAATAGKQSTGDKLKGMWQDITGKK